MGYTVWHMGGGCRLYGRPLEGKDSYEQLMLMEDGEPDIRRCPKPTDRVMLMSFRDGQEEGTLEGQWPTLQAYLDEQG